MVWRATSRFPVVQYTLLYRKVLKNLWTFLERSTNNNLIIRRLEKKHLPTVHCAGGRVGVGDSSDTWRPGRSWRQGSFTSCKNLTFLNGEAKSVVSWKSSISFFYHSLQIRRWWLYKSVERFFSLSSNFLSVGNGPPCGWILRYLIRVTFNSNNRHANLKLPEFLAMIISAWNTCRLKCP